MYGLEGRRRDTGEDAAFDELQSLAALTAEAAAVAMLAGVPAGVERARRRLRYATLLHELARRTGRVELLARAASAASAAAREAPDHAATQAESLYAVAETQRLAFLLVGELECIDEALARLDALTLLKPAPVMTLKAKALRSAIVGAAALAAGDGAGVVDAVHTIETAAKALGLIGGARAEATPFLIERADLCVGLAIQSRDRTSLLAAVTDVTALVARIDADRLPLSWARAQTLRGQALAALGDVAGDARAVAEAVAVLKEAVTHLAPRHSPLDEARLGHALGLALQSLGEACDEDALFDGAVKAFAPALEALDAAPELPYRSIVAHDGAICLARRAERRGDLDALEQAEATFRDALKQRRAGADPLAWAVTQVALARIYEAQAGLREDRGERADAAFALSAALEVFAEHGHSALSAATLQALERIKEKA